MDVEKSKDVTIQVRNVSKSFRIYFDKGHMLKEKLLFANRNKYETRKVLDDISFDIYKGEAVGLIGINGCGKSTALKLLTKIIYPDTGIINVKGRVSSLLELGAGFHPDLSGKENIYINASIFGLKKYEIDDKLDEIIEFSELGECINNPVRTYSSGMYMRLAFSVAINVQADILLVDEILAVGDAGFQSKCLQKIAEIKKQGTTIVLVSHSMNQIEKVCDRCIWINNSRIAAVGETNDVTQKYIEYIEETERKKLAARHINTSETFNDIDMKEESKIRLLSVKLLDINDNEKKIWGIGERIAIKLDFASSIDTTANLRFEIMRADGILAYADIYDNCGRGYLLKKENHFCFTIKVLNFLAGKFFVSIYAENGIGGLIGSLTPFAEFDIIDDSSRYGVAKIDCECIMN